MPVCPRAYLWGWSDFYEILSAGPLYSSRGSVLLWRRCDTLWTSGFMDDVMFGRNGPYGETRRLHHREATTSGVVIPTYAEPGVYERWLVL